jgi:hypothetical protein
MIGMHLIDCRKQVSLPREFLCDETLTFGMKSLSKNPVTSQSAKRIAPWELLVRIFIAFVVVFFAIAAAGLSTGPQGKLGLTSQNLRDLAVILISFALLAIRREGRTMVLIFKGGAFVVLLAAWLLGAITGNEVWATIVLLVTVVVVFSAPFLPDEGPFIWQLRDTEKPDGDRASLKPQRERLTLAVAVIALVVSAVAVALPYIVKAGIDERSLQATAVLEGHGYVKVKGQEFESVTGPTHQVVVTPANYANSDQTLWVVVHTPQQDRWYPTKLAQKLDATEDVTVELGEVNGKGLFQIFVYAVPSAYESVFSTASATKGLGGLPGGLAKPLASIKVDRTR